MGFEKGLKEEYLAVYNEVLGELTVEDISSTFTEEVKSDILDMFLSAQEDGVSPKSIVGDSPKAFVEAIVGDFNKRNSGVFRLLQIIYRIPLSIAGVSVVNIRNGQIEVTLDMILAVIAIILCDAIGRVLSRKYQITKSRKKSKLIIEWGTYLAIGAIVVGFTVFNHIEPIFIVKSPFIFIWSLLVVGIILLCVVESNTK